MSEMVHIVDENDKVIDTVSRKEMREKNLRHRSTFILVFNSKEEILITKRTTSKDAYPGLYELTRGGTVESHETWEENALKELDEEIGARKVPVNFLFTFNYEDEIQSCVGMVYKCIYDGKITTQVEEVESFMFLTLQECEEMIKNEGDNICGDSLYAFKKYLKEHHGED
jgi:isopentenyldiphosphate isomerase